MNPNLTQLHPYPFEKLAILKHGIVPPNDKTHIALSIGEPKHPTPGFIQQALLENLSGLANYPTTKGLLELRAVISEWLAQRFDFPADAINPNSQVLPVCGTREALFSFVQAMVDSRKKPLVIMPNPFYQIYEGAALLAGAEPYYLNTTPETNYLPDFDSVPAQVWQRCQVLFICSPGNPTGTVIDKATHIKLIQLAHHYNFIIASDECYTEIYHDETRPPQGLLQTAYEIGNTNFDHCIMFQSLSKRSNAPGLRSGFVAGDARLLKDYFCYRTYHGCAMSLPVQHASISAWQDEEHVRENRHLYRQKFAAVLKILKPVCDVKQPKGGFYLWLKTPIVETEFARQLYAQQNVTVLPGSYLSRDWQGINPGANHVRIALVAPIDECIDAAERIKQFLN